MNEVMKQACELESQVMMNVYGREKEATPYFVSGKGAKLLDADGKEYLDFLSGLGVCNLGHVPEKVVAKAKAQLETLIHTSNLYYTGPQIELADKLIRHSFGDKVFFANSGAEANEAAIKLARKYSYQKYGSGRSHIITMNQSFHGRSLATITATGQEKVKKGFWPLPEGFTHVPVNDLETLKKEIKEETCAIFLEPILGEGGVYPVNPAYMEELSRICSEKDILLMFDEVQTGMGRTGTLFCYEHFGVAPDIMTIAKGLGGGLPIGAMIATQAASDGFTKGDHGSTFGGNPVACAAGSAVMDLMLEDGFFKAVEEKAHYLNQSLAQLSHLPEIKEIRQLGMMVGVEITLDAKTVKTMAQESGLIVNAIGDHIIRLLPPLIVEKEDIHSAVAILKSSLEKAKKKSTES